MENILKNRTAVVHGAGSIGRAVAAAFAQAGATVFVAAHREDTLKKLADKQILTERLDVLDEEAVAAFVKTVVQKTGHVDISFCATSTHTPGGEQGAALSELRYEDFSMPLIDFTKATFNTAKAVYPYMVKQHSGVIMGMTAVVSQMPLPYTAGFGLHGPRWKRCCACWQQNWGHMACAPSACTRLVRKAQSTRRSPRTTLSWSNAPSNGEHVG